MDSKIIQEKLKQFKIEVLILVLGIAVFAYLLSSIIPIVQNIDKHNKDYDKAQKALVEKNRILKELQDKKAKEESEEINKVEIKQFFRPITSGGDTESIIADEFAEILVLIRENSIKTKSINYEYNPQDDNFVKNLPDQYYVARLNLEMFSSYKNFERFLKELYKHEHFLDISSVEIIPYRKDKKILMIKFQLKLYAKK